jgi:hypothetical protein
MHLDISKLSAIDFDLGLIEQSLDDLFVTHRVKCPY